MIYKKEVNLRNDFRLESSVTRLLELLDSKLNLTSEQKETLHGKLRGWKKVTELPLSMYEI